MAERAKSLGKLGDPDFANRVRGRVNINPLAL
jgi:hypothetical protein